MKRIILIFALMLIASGCAPNRDFKFGASHLININSKYGTSMDAYPENPENSARMLKEFIDLKGLKLDIGQGAFDQVLKYRILDLEANELFIQSQKYGQVGTTKYGFGCKARPLILESVKFRNESALKGFEAVTLLKSFADKFPKESDSVGLSQKNALFLNATYYRISIEARDDSNIINNFCPVNETLEIYRQTFRRGTNLSEDYINNLGYDEAVKIWKDMEGIQ